MWDGMSFLLSEICEDSTNQFTKIINVVIDFVFRIGNKHRLFVITSTGIDEVSPLRWKIKSSKGDWEGARFATTAAGYLYLLKGEEVYRISPKSPGSRPLKKSWPGAEWMCALGDKLYLSTTKGDYLLDGKTLKGEKIGEKKTRE